MRGTARRFLIDGDGYMPWRGVAAVLLAVVVPVLLAVTVFGPAGAAVFIAALPAHLAAKQAGIYAATVVTMVTAMGGVLALGSLEMSLLVAACLAIITSIGFRHGLATPCLRALFTWTVFTGPILPADEKPLILLLSIAAIFWSVSVTWAMGEAADASEEESSGPEFSLLFGAMLGVGLVLSVYIGARFFGPHGFWFPLTFAVLWIPPFGQLFTRTAKRTAGTVAGVALAMALAIGVESEATRAAIALAIVPFAFRILPRSYAGFTALLTMIVLEALSLVSDLDALAVERIWSMLAAALTAGLLGLLAFAILRRVAPDALDELMQPSEDDTREEDGPNAQEPRAEPRGRTPEPT
ncbi:hypothetical protein ROJ8625_00030 [Roseivivax jejudonensis]|uniref:Integral membrane bound transporter domain-containing protein n=1 Tax=Roseivivax jejudonensis TaxID=1529041 RepID=A0A1X6Y3X5_9RHOB|nr:FUSC family protein [Roseivivax jejudonensis]SLN09593.1 hypothetical protein ROJ8625_00030 [Roseivivax jejudonensis]